MKIKYKNEIYNVKFKDGISISKRKMLLDLRRIKRFGLRILYVFKKDLLFLFIAIILYVLIVSFVEHNLMGRELIESIWNTKSEIFTVFIVVAMNSIINFERNWRKKIREWYYVYLDLLYFFENDIRELNIAVKIKNQTYYYVFNTKEVYKKFKEEFCNYIIEDNQINKNKIIEILAKIEKQVDEVKENFYKNGYMIENNFMINNDMFIHSCNSLKDAIYNFKKILDTKQKINIKDNLILIYDNMYYIIVNTRKLWRTEINLDREIINILKINNEKAIEKKFFLNSLIFK